MRCKIPAADLSLKLNDTVCRYKKEAVYVRVEKSRLSLYKMEHTSAPFIEIKSNDPDFDISSPPLGYCQYRDEVIYLTRTPVRKTRQGLDQRYVRARKLNSNETLAKGNTSTYMFQVGFSDMVINKYPSLGDALKKLRGLHSKNPRSNAQIALSREIAMWIDEMARINIYYKGDFVGWIQPDKTTVHVPSDERAWVVSKFLSHELSWEID